MRSALTLLALATLALVAACDDAAPAAPSATETLIATSSATATATAIPSPSVTPTPTPSGPIGTPGVLPTGIEAVDSVVDAVTSGDLDAVLALLAYTEVECSDVGYGPRCDVLHLPAGTMVRGLSMGSCDAGIVPGEQVPDALADLLQREEPLEVWSIYEIRGTTHMDGSDRRDPDKRYALLFTTASAAAPTGPVVMLWTMGGQITGAYTGACQERVNTSPDVARWIVYPADLGWPLDAPTPTPVP